METPSTPACATNQAGLGTPITGIPSLPRHWIQRARLDERLSGAAGHRLTLVIGPPGAGKTALLSGWAQHCLPGGVAWLGLETADDEKRHFWLRLLGAFRSVAPSVGRRTLEALGRQDAMATELVDLLSTDLMEIGPTVLIMDDFHVISDPEIIATVSHLVGHLPCHIRLVVASRHALRFPSHRLRVSGQLLEIGESDLRFTADETAALLLAATDRPVARDDVEVLTGRTEGWAAGLRLGALVLADEGRPSEFVRRFTGEYDLVAEYFQHEVLDAEPPDVVQFLLQTSVLDEMTGAVCQEITGRADAGQILEYLARSNVFMVRLDSTNRWYRYHAMFGSFLRYRLATAQPSLADQAHLRAAHWLQGNGDGRAATHHLVQAEAYDQALVLGVTDVVERLNGGFPCDAAVVLPADLPEWYFERDPFRMYVLVSALLCALRAADAAPWLRRLALGVADDSDNRGLQRRVELLWTIHDALVGDGPGVIQHYERAAQLFAGDKDLTTPRQLAARYPWLDAVDSAIWGQLPPIVAHAYLWLDRPDRARAVMDNPPRDEDRYDSLAYLVVRAMIAREEGRLRETYALARNALDEAARHSASAVGTLGVRLAIATVFRERDDLEAAEEQLSYAVSISQRTGQTRWIATADCERVELLMAQGHHTNALDELRRLRKVELTEGLPDGLMQRLDRIEIRCRLALGDLEGATLAVKSMAPDLCSEELLAGLDLCAGRPDRAVARLTTGQNDSRDVRADIQRLVLLARAHLQLGDQRRADAALRRAIDRGRPEGYIRVFLEDGRELLFLLRGIAGQFPDAFIAELISHADHVHPDATEPFAQTLEPLTVRERELLSYLPSHLSQHEIARTMYVSVNTVKTHIKGVYRKLGAESRSQAVTLARVHGLL